MNFILLFSGLSFAVIHGEDNRMDTFQSSALAQELGRSVPALIQKHRIQTLENGKFKLTGTPMQKLGLCSDEIFAEESNIANCSASFIGKDLVLTAAHCMNETHFKCESYAVVFDYARSSAGPTEHVLDEDSVYHCKKIIYSKFDQTLASEDLAIIQLDREVKNREPIRLDPDYLLKVGESLMMIGYPMGISQKAVEEGKVLSVDRKNVSFKHDLDTFSVNSGGPMFNLKGHQIGVLVRGTGANFSGDQCYRWMVGNFKDYSESNDISSLQSVLHQLGI